MSTKIKHAQRPIPLAAHLRSSASVLALVALGALTPALAQDETDADEEEQLVEEVYVTGLRSSIMSAQNIKRNADNILDSIVAEDIGKLPDRSVTEALQRLPGVSVSRFDNPGDPEHFAGEGAGVTIRGLPQVRGELNGGDIFSADGGRGLSFDDVPAELMAGVDVYKSPTADRVEGGLGGIVDLRTRLPFDTDGQQVSFTAKANYGDIIDETNFEFSGLYSNRWDVGNGELGFLVDFSTSEISSRADNILTRSFHPRVPGGDGDFAEIEADKTVYVPRGADWRRNDYERTRDGQYLALQWAPSDQLEFYLTAFRSEAQRNWLENGFFLDAGGGFDSFLPVKATDDWVYDNNDALVSGTITTAQGNGIPFGTSTRLAENTSETRDISTGFEWQATEKLRVTGDFQRVDSSSKTEDYTLGLVAYPQNTRVTNLNTMSGTPSIGVDAGFLEDYSNYSYGQMMMIVADNEAESTAARIDLEYAFEDSIVKSVKTGARFSDKSADNRGGNNWSARYQPWQIGSSWQPYPSSDALPKITDTQYITEFSFGDFQRGNTDVPASAWLYDASYLRDFQSTADAVVAVTPGGCCAPDYAALDLDDVNNINTQDETTRALYVRMDFGFDNLPMPISGNIGVRYVETDNVAHGQISFPTFTLQETDDDGNVTDEFQPFYADDLPFDADNSYSNVLPSLNLSMQASEDVVIRFAAAKGIWRPEFWRMKALINLSADFRDDVDEPDNIDDFTPDMVDFTLSSDGTNPYLEPMEADQLDLSAEWYFNEEGGMLYAALFNKDVKDFFRTATLQFEDFEGYPAVTSEITVNTGTADISGFEVGGTYFFDSLPEPFNGIGVQANYTKINSDTNVPIETQPIDTDGSEYASLPLEGLSEDTYNFMLMYEKYGWNARLAYNWRSEQLLDVGPNGWNGSNGGIDWRLPVYSDDYGQLDFSLGYDISSAVSVHFDAYNIGQSDTRGVIDQNAAGNHTAFVYSQDTRYSLSLRANF